MKKAIILAVALTLVLSGMALATVVSTKHDMRLNASVTASGVTQVCVFCHHPHRGAQADTNVNDQLLWNMCYNEDAKGYSTYAATETTTAGVNGNPTTAPQSILCMSCHDGTSGAPSFLQDSVEGTITGNPRDDFAVGVIDIGTTFTDDHPIGFVYPTVGAANIGDLETTTVDLGDGITYIEGSAGAGASGTYPLFGGGLGTGTMECSTCHNVHNAGPSPTLIQFMRGEVAQSSICIDCHTAK